MLFSVQFSSASGIDSLLKIIQNSDVNFTWISSETLLELRLRRDEISDDSLRFIVDQKYAMRLYYVAEARLAQEELLKICAAAKTYPSIVSSCYLYLAALPGAPTKKMEYIRMAAQLVKNDLDSASIFLAYADVYTSLGQNDEAVKNYLKAISIYRKYNEENNLATAYNNLGTHYAQNEAYKAAEVAFQKCLDYALSTDDKSLQVNCYINLGQIMDIKGNTRGALQYLHRAENIALSDGIITNLYTIYHSMGIAHYMQKQYDSAYDYSILALVMKDSLLDLRRMQGYAMAEERYKTAERKQRIAELEVAEQVQRQAVADKENRIRFILTLSVALLIACGLLAALVFSLKKRNIILKELADRNTELYLKKIDEIVKSSELKTVNAILEAQEIERKRIAADLHDRLGNVLSTIKLHFKGIEARLNKIESESAQQVGEAAIMIDQAVQEVRRISHDMASGVLSGFGLEAAIEDLAENLKRTRQIEVFTDLHLGNSRMSHKVERTIYKILQELVTNTLKHAEASEIQIQSVKHSDHLSFVFEDNGKGMSLKQDIEGMGLKNIRERLEGLGGKFNIDSAPLRGTIVNIEIPLYES
jgi:signal transduction histidine kinase